MGMIQITSDIILNLILSVIIFGGMNEFERRENKKYSCPSYCGVVHEHDLGLPTRINPEIGFDIKVPIYIGLTDEKKP